MDNLPSLVYPPPSDGGAIVVYEIAPALSDLGNDVAVVALENTLPENVLKHGVNGYFVKDGNDYVDKVTKLLANESLNADMVKGQGKSLKRILTGRFL